MSEIRAKRDFLKSNMTNELILIEDFAPLRRVLTEALRSAGYNVTGFEDGVISRDAEVMKRADLLITDVEMPEVDGHEVLEIMRRDHPTIRTVVISGTPEENLAGIEATAILRKPFEPDELVDTVRRTLA